MLVPVIAALLQSQTPAWSPDTPLSAQVQEDLASIERADWLKISSPVTKCVKAGFGTHKVDQDKRGDAHAAQAFAMAELNRCSLKSAQRKLRAVLKRDRTKPDPNAVERRVQSASSLIEVATLLGAYRLFGIEDSTISEAPVETPRPIDNSDNEKR